MSADDLRYTASHEWVRPGDPLTIGITDFAQEQLGDVIFVELPQVGATLNAGDTFGSVESVKTVSDVYIPVSGTVAEVNTTLVEQPELVNSSPFGDGWLIRLTASDPTQLDGLLDNDAYEAATRG